MRYYQADDKLIQFNPETNVYRIRNSIKNESKLLTEEDFKELIVTELKKQNFSEKMNVFFKNVKEQWIFKGTRYRKLDNFEVDRKGECTNYNLNDIPKHNPLNGEYSWNKDFILVYHWGRVYLFNYSYNGYPQGQLFNADTGQVCQWCKPKNCAPIFNVDKHLIV